jgi:dipeptidyl aminopeptidase/acylaminoacyl peptidase
MAGTTPSKRFGSLFSFGRLLTGAPESEPGRRKAPRPRGRTRLTFEALDRRELFSASPITSIVGHSPAPVQAYAPAVLETITSPDGKNQAQIVENLNGTYSVVENGNVVATANGSISNLMFSPTGDHLAFVECNKSNSSPTGFTCSAVEDGKVVGTASAIGELAFSQDGKDFAFMELSLSATSPTGLTFSAVENGKVVATSDDGIKDLTFNPVGDQLAFVEYTTSTSSPTGYTVSVVENGNVVATSNDQMSDLTFSSDGKHFAFVEANQSTNGNTLYSVIEDGKTVSGPSSNLPSGLSFQGDKLTIG